jgi:hypothetical protein
MEAEMTAWLGRVARLRELYAERPDLGIPELAFLPEARWFEVARTLRVGDEKQLCDTFGQLRNKAESLFIDKLRQALRSYLEAHGGQLPAEARELAAFFDPPLDPAILDRYRMVASGQIGDWRSGPLLEQHTPLDFTRDTVWDIGLNSGPKGNDSESALRFFVRRAIQAFTQANAGTPPTQPEELLRYLPGEVEPGRLKQFLPPSR